jgi:hypothetical protein
MNSEFLFAYIYFLKMKKMQREVHSRRVHEENWEDNHGWIGGGMHLQNISAPKTQSGFIGAADADDALPVPATGDRSKREEWLAMDKGHRNAGAPPASAFKIPKLGEEVDLASSPTSITRMQFTWYVEKTKGDRQKFTHT